MSQPTQQNIVTLVCGKINRIVFIPCFLSNLSSLISGKTIPAEALAPSDSPFSIS